MQRKNHWSGQCEEWRVEPEQHQRYLSRTYMKHYAILHYESPLFHRYKCHICNRGYYFQSYLREHMLTHADYKKFKCSVCKYATGRKGDLIRHLKNNRHIFKVESEINVTKRSDSYLEKDAVDTFSVDRRLRISCRTIISTDKIGSPVPKKGRFTRIIKGDTLFNYTFLNLIFYRSRFI